jgi:hypothetical protein
MRWETTKGLLVVTGMAGAHLRLVATLIVALGVVTTAAAREGSGLIGRVTRHFRRGSGARAWGLGAPI